MITLKRKTDILNHLMDILLFEHKRSSECRAYSLWLCIFADKMKLQNKITDKEYSWLITLIKDNRPKFKEPNESYWRANDVKSRITFINKLLKRLN